MTTSTTKKQLFTAVAMLLVATLALGTATYAWFVNNTKVEVAQMQFQAQTSTSLEVAPATSGEVDSPKFGEYKGLITVDDVNTYLGTRTVGATLTKFLLRPASTSLPAMTAGHFFREKADGLDLNELKFTTFEAITVADLGTTKSGIVVMPLSFRASEDMGVYLTTDSSITAGALGSDEAYAAMRVAIVDKDGVGKVIYTTDKENTNRKNTTTQIKDTTDPNKVIGGIDKVGVPTVESPKVPPVTIGSISKAPAKDAIKIADGTAGNQLFKLTKGTAKTMYVVIWLEGCDYDCVSAAASTNFKIKLNFMGGNVVV